MDVFVYGKRRSLPEGFEEFLTVSDTAIVSIDLHQGHLADTADCPCPAPRAREVVDRVNRFHAAARALDVPVIHVKSVLRRDGSDDVNGIKSAWRFVFPLHVGPIPNSDQHAIQGSRWTEFVTEVAEGDHIVETKKRLSAFYPTDLDFLLRNMGVQAAGVERLHDRLLHSQQRLRCQQPGISRHGRTGPRSRHQCRYGGRSAENGLAAIGLVVESRDLIEEWHRQIEISQALISRMREKVASA